MKLKSRTIIPQDGWWYIQPQTDFRIDAEHFEQLIDRVIEHRKYKELIPTSRHWVAIEVENQICKRVEKQFVIYGG